MPAGLSSSCIFHHTPPWFSELLPHCAPLISTVLTPPLTYSRTSDVLPPVALMSVLLHTPTRVFKKALSGLTSQVKFLCSRLPCVAVPHVLVAIGISHSLAGPTSLEVPWDSDCVSFAPNCMLGSSSVWL